MASLESRLNDLLEQWEDLRDQGRAVSPEELCGDAPELLDELKRRVRALEAFDPLLRTVDPLEWTAGTRLGPYEILGPLGDGGMGQVYCARDVKLDRRVAIKVVRDDFAAESQWLARFEREARLLAALTHPNIATVYGLDEFGDRHCIVMELVPGETLARRLAAGPLPLDEALGVGRQIAEALETAHERGIIHRDLKPTNVMLTPEGKAKVLDFGLAKSTLPPQPSTETVSQYEGQTGEGVILGTAAYMAPEQARGRPVDRRCDIWALGCVLFEVLTGRPVYRGQSFHDTLAEVFEKSPDWNSLPANVPPRVEDLLRRCLQKDPQRRLRDAGDFRLELEDALADLARGPVPAKALPAGPSAPQRAGRLTRLLQVMTPATVPAARARWWPVLAAAVVALAAFALGRWVLPSAPEASATTHWSGQLLLQVEPVTFGPRASPDGKWLAFVVLHEGQAQVGVTKLDSGEWWVLTRKRDRGQVLGVSWSRDSTRIFFDRYHDVPAGVFSASPLDRAPQGAREVPVVKEACCPHVMVDGSLVVLKRDSAGNHQMHRYTPGQALRPVGPPVELERGWTAPLRSLHRSNRVVFCGKVLDGKAPRTRRFYLLDLETNEYRPLGTEEVAAGFVPLAISGQDEFLYTTTGHDDACHIVRVPLAGPFTPQPVLTLTMNVYGMDVDFEDRLYVDQVQRPMVVLRFDVPLDGTPAAPLPAERLTEPMLWGEIAPLVHPLELPDGRQLMPTKVAGRDRLAMAKLGKEPLPLLHDSHEETSLPAVRLGQDRLAFTMGSGSGRRLRLATIDEGGVRLEPTDLGIQSGNLTGLASTPDGKTLYFVQARQVYQVPTDGSKPPQKVAAGDAVAVEPQTGALLIQHFDDTSTRLRRLPRPGSPVEDVPVQLGPWRLAPLPLAGDAIHPDGRVLVTIAAPDATYWQTGVLGPEGKLQPIPVAFNGDVIPGGWSKDGKVLAVGFATFSDLWRFTPRVPAGAGR